MAVGGRGLEGPRPLRSDLNNAGRDCANDGIIAVS